jgi:hypothetical protein
MTYSIAKSTQYPIYTRLDPIPVFNALRIVRRRLFLLAQGGADVALLALGIGLLQWVSESETGLRSVNGDRGR